MADISVLQLDEDTRDLCFDEDGNLACLYDAEAITQNIRNNLNTWKGEFPLDTEHGMDWDSVVQSPISDATSRADDAARKAIFQEPYVKTIDELEISTENRKLTIDFDGTLYDSSTVRLEVSKNG